MTNDARFVPQAGPAGLPRLLAGLPSSTATMTLAEHETLHGPLPSISGRDLLEVVDRSGLRGRGGADFPTATKLRAVAGRRGATLVVNGSESEPASAKDRLLLAQLPHLVLDGAELAARAIGAGQAIAKVSDRSPLVLAALKGAVAMRPEDRVSFEVISGPGGYVTGEETAVLHYLERGVAKPTLVPPRPDQRGLRGRPTLVQNSETLAQLALIARFGSDWFRELGTEADPGSVLVTVSGAVRDPGVYEHAFGTSMADLLAAAGGPTEPLQALLVGGYFGAWVPAVRVGDLRLSRDELHSVGAALGAGVLIALGESACGLHESARVIDYLAGQSAGQCGPCVNGLAAIADSVGALADGRAHRHELARLLRWTAEVRGRGACHHPDGVARFVESAVSVFAHELERHRRGRCAARPAGLPLATPALDAASREPRRRAIR